MCVTEVLVVLRLKSAQAMPVLITTTTATYTIHRMLREREKGLEQLSHTPQHSSHLSPGSACELKWSEVTQQSDREDGEECHSYEYSTVDQGGAGGSRTNPLQSKLDNLVKLGEMGGMI